MLNMFWVVILQFLFFGCATTALPPLQQPVTQPPSGSQLKLERLGDHYLLQIPNKSWVMRFPAGQFQVLIDKPSRGYFFLMHQSILHSLDIEKGGGQPDMPAVFAETRDDPHIVSF